MEEERYCAMKAIPQDKWQWFGKAGHFICGQWCRFHLTTEVGPWLVSTVGEYVHPRHSGGSEAIELAWMKENAPGDDIGCDRKYETMVFKAGKRCDAEGCQCGQPMLADSANLDFLPANDVTTARANHMKLCRKWARKAKP